MFVEYQPSTPSRSRLEARRDDGLDERLAGLQVLACERRTRLTRQLEQGGHIGAQVRRGVRVRHAFLDRRVRVNHARRNRGIGVFESLLERRQRLVYRRFLEKNLGAAAPDQDDPVQPVRDS